MGMATFPHIACHVAGRSSFLRLAMSAWRITGTTQQHQKNSAAGWPQEAAALPASMADFFADNVGTWQRLGTIFQSVPSADRGIVENLAESNSLDAFGNRSQRIIYCTTLLVYVSLPDRPAAWFRFSVATISGKTACFVHPMRTLH